MFEKQILKLNNSFKKYKSAIKKVNSDLDETFEGIITNNISNAYDSSNIEGLLNIQYGIIADHAIILTYLESITNEAINRTNDVRLQKEIIRVSDELNASHQELTESIIQYVENTVPFLLALSLHPHMVNENMESSSSTLVKSRKQFVKEETNAAKMAISRINSHKINVNDSEYFNKYMSYYCKSFATALQEFNQDSQISHAAAVSSAESREYTETVESISREIENGRQMTVDELMLYLVLRMSDNYKETSGAGDGRTSSSSSSAAAKSAASSCSSDFSNTNTNSNLASMSEGDRILEESAREFFPRLSSSSIRVNSATPNSVNATTNSGQPHISEQEARLDAMLEEAINELYGSSGTSHSTDHSI